MKRLLPSLACSFLLFSTFAGAETYDARIAEKQILTPPPPVAPRVNGPMVYGARPGRKFIYRIPTQGERPIRFEVKGLPEGLTLDSDKGIITGVTPGRSGDYPMTFTAKNGQGAAKRPFKLVVGDKLALTPPVGWNSWGGHMLMVSDQVMRRTADLLVAKGLADVGFQYVSIDDCWMRISPESYAARTEAKKQQHAGFDYDGLIGEERDAQGNILPNRNFPDMQAMTDYIHAHGLKVGIYSSPGPYTCQNFAGSFGHEQQDAGQYARWGFDLLKYDQCSGGGVLNKLKQERPGFKTPDFWRPMAGAIRAQDRDILFNLCQYGLDAPWTWAPDLGIQSWRTGGDLNHHVTTYFEQALRLATTLRAFSQPGQWSDPDFMYIHKIRDHKRMVAPTVEIPLNTNQRYQYVTLWAIIAAPFFFSCDTDAIDEFTIRLLANADVVGINQDELGHVAEVVRGTDGEVVMVKRLADGSRAVALLNRNATSEAEITLGTDWWGASGSVTVFDVWRQRTLKNLQSGDMVR
ncbi:MAG: putative Ig domain-containing protein, partial [Planctomycetota bacterium]|nr:putative Ig domain-containing protein [Planctomycetota bacterium]